jgi:hypothetical protein
MKSTASVALAVLLTSGASACDARRAAENVATPVNGQAAQVGEGQLRLASGGLLALPPGGGPGNRVDFGTPAGAAIEAVSAVLGSPTQRGANEECGAGPMEFSEFGTLTLNFQNGTFVGWSLAGPPRSPPLRSATGVGIGTARDQIMGEGEGPLRVSETSLGTQFDARGIIGLLSGPQPDATVTRIWAGTNCIFE